MASGDLIIASLRGGQNDTLPPNALADDECVLAENVEFFFSTCGERRAGCGPFPFDGAGLATQTAVVHLSQWFPTNNVVVPDYWAVAATPAVSTIVSYYHNGAAIVVTPADAFSTVTPDLYEVVTQSLNGLLFFAYHSAVDRLHVWDGTSLRRVGLGQPIAAPTGANTGSGTYTGARYFRVRFVDINGSGVIVRRSEPSVSLIFTPSGSGSGVVITRPALLGEGETSWELEASTDNANYYRIATQTTAVLNATYTDSTVYATGYANAGVLSEDIGAYTLLPSAKFLTVDGDRLILGGHWTDAALKSRVWWTPVAADPGVGNSERVPLEIDNFVDLDNYAGGPLTGLSSGVNGSWYAFKWTRIYKMVRTGDVNRAYDVITLSTTRGAIPGSIINGIDENGAACIYFLDPTMGPSRLGNSGLQVIYGLRGTWGRINLQATKEIARGLYYPYKQQVHWWLAVDGANSPNLKIVLQVSNVQPSAQGGVGRGWSTATGRIAEAYAAAVFTEGVTIDAVVSVSDRPFIGLTAPDCIQRCDTEITDAGVAYVATIRTKPYVLAGLLNCWGGMCAALLATANATASLKVKFIRDFGIETNDITTDLIPEATEDLVIKRFDDLVMSEATVIQVEFTDA